MYSVLQLFLYSLLGSVIALIGGVVFLYQKKWSKILEKNAIPFAAGVLITVAILGLMPEAIELIGTRAFPAVFISFLTVYIFENFIFSLHHHGEDHEHNKKLKSSVPIVIIGDTLHNLIDGVAIGASFLTSPGLGLITALSTFFHEVPHEIGDFGIMLKAGWSRKNILLVNAISASFTIVGAFSLYFVSENDLLVGYLLAVSAGIFLYLSSIDFLPHALEDAKKKKSALLPLILGVIIMLLILYFIPHTE